MKTLLTVVAILLLSTSVEARCMKRDRSQCPENVNVKMNVTIDKRARLTNKQVSHRARVKKQARTDQMLNSMVMQQYQKGPAPKKNSNRHKGTF